MRGYLETLQMSDSDVSIDANTRARYFETVSRETRRLETIVADLLDLARYENGVASLSPRVFAIDRVFEHIVRRHERDVQERGITLRTHVAPEADQVVADPDRVEQALENLVSNALRHTPEDGTIDMCASIEYAQAPASAPTPSRAAQPSQVVLSVIDSGTGIGPEHLAHVFDRFYQIDAARTAGANGKSANGKGSGLGLSIVKAIVERHGGTIAVTSVPGRTEFRIALPQAALTERALDQASTNL
jgi:signal transduction histidine kinase